jgi:hypothetical protein
MTLRQLPHLPLAEGKQRRFRQREEETRARENQDRRHRKFHAQSVEEKSDGQKEKQGRHVPSGQFENGPAFERRESCAIRSQRRLTR